MTDSLIDKAHTVKGYFDSPNSYSQEEFDYAAQCATDVWQSLRQPIARQVSAEPPHCSHTDFKTNCPECIARKQWLQRREISVVDEPMIVGGICELMQDCLEHFDSDHAQSLFNFMRPYLRTTEPVMIDLEAGAKAIASKRFPHAPAVTPHSLSLAKVCAEAWGLKYVD